jgi:H+/Cl- antiporter ClcA
MKRRFNEETVLFFSVLKWFFLSTIIGLIVGTGATIFLKLLTWGIRAAANYKYYFLFLPAAIVLTAAAVKYLAPEAEGHGTEKVIEAVHKRSGKINLLVVPVKLVTTILTISFGGSAGKEGPCAQIGSGLASGFADIFRFSDTGRKKIVICGLSAGFASVFGTPIAGAIFGIEVLVVGQLMYDVLLPSFIAGIISYQVSSNLGITYFYKPLNFVPVFNEFFFIKVVLSGIFFGIMSFLFVETHKSMHRLSRELKISWWIKAAVSGIIVGAPALFLGTKYLGLGLNHIESFLGGSRAPWFDPLLKMFFTAVTLDGGGSGGVITPIFFIGSSAGSFFSSFMGVDTATFAAIGMVALLAGAANTPIAASIMSIELFGPKIAPYAAVACVISFLMTGHRSIYSSQLLGMSKSKSLETDIGREISKANTSSPMAVDYLTIIKAVFLKLLKKNNKKQS